MKITVHSENEKKRPVFGGRKSDSVKAEKEDKPEKKRKSGGLSLGGNKHKDVESEPELEQTFKQRQVMTKSELEPEPDVGDDDTVIAMSETSDEVSGNHVEPKAAEENAEVEEGPGAESPTPKLKLAKSGKKRPQPVVEDDDIDSDEYFDEMYDTYARDTDSLTPSFGILVVVLIVVLSVAGYFAGGVLFDMMDMLGLV